MRIDAQAQSVLNDLYLKFESNSEVSISAPEYDQLQIDYLIESGLLTKTDASTLSGWAYIVKPTYEGKVYISHLKEAPITKLHEFIRRGEEIGKKEYHPAERGFAISYVSGPLYNAWMDEINIFNERYLKGHPMHDQIYQTYFHRRNRPSAYEDMMGHLYALSADDEFKVEKIEEGRIQSVKNRNPAIGRMLQEDIDRCKSFLSDSKDESVGLDLYIEITSRYDSIIPNLGAGLYQCMPEQHWYDPEISGLSLIFNLKSIMNKMLAYQAVNYPIQETGLHIIERKSMSNKVFIVHGHDDAAIATLVKMRLDYLHEDNGCLDDVDIMAIKRGLPNYFKEHMDRDLFVYVVREEQVIVACAFLLVIEKPMSPAFINGKTGTVLNVYTCPSYRNRKYAKMIMQALLSKAKELQLSVVDLKSTEDGYHLYKSVGFTDDCSKYHLMKWKNPDVENNRQA